MKIYRPFIFLTFILSLLPGCQYFTQQVRAKRQVSVRLPGNNKAISYALDTYLSGYPPNPNSEEIAKVKAASDLAISVILREAPSEHQSQVVQNLNTKLHDLSSYPRIFLYNKNHKPYKSLEPLANSNLLAS